jgi:Right handed beta helix region
VEPETAGSRRRGWPSWRVVGLSTPLLIGLTAALTFWSLGWTLDGVRKAMTPSAFLPAAGQRTVAAGESIAEAMRDAPAGTEIIVEPGEYREQITLLPGVRLRSSVPGGATIRLPAGVRDGADVAAVVARNVSGAEIVDFRISGDSATPLPVGILVQNSTVSIVNVEITGATRAAVEFAGGGASTLMASNILGNSGSALTVRDGDKPRISHNIFARNGDPDRGATFVVRRSSPTFTQNVFVGSTSGLFDTLNGAAGTELRRDNFFVPAEQPASRR